MARAESSDQEAEIREDQREEDVHAGRGTLQLVRLCDIGAVYRLRQCPCKLN